METSLPNRDYTRRRGELSTFGRAINAASRIKIAFVVFTVAIVAALCSAFVLPNIFAVVLTSVVVIAGCFYLWRMIQQHLVEPGLATRKWLQQICDGELDSTISLPGSHPHYKELDFHTRNVGTSLRRLSDEMESLVEGQTRRLENQNQILELLFQLTADVAQEIDQQSLLDKICKSLSTWLDGVPVGAYLLGKDNEISLQAQAGELAFANHCHFDELNKAVTLSDGEVRIPVFRTEEVVGLVHIIGTDSEQLASSEYRQVFHTVSEQLSMFIAKNSVLESAQQARVIEERVRLGAELHDSLAQTLLASKYQLQMLRETLQGDPLAPVVKDIERVEGIIDEANVEVRELIGQTRQSGYEQQYADALSNVIDEFNRTGAIPVFFQNDNPHMRVTAREASVLQRIVSEALVNANKYSQATSIRVYLRVEKSGARSLLIEDDGVGFQDGSCVQNASGDSTGNRTGIGEHIGLSIMRDRALSVGGILTVDSEPGEGTRISLKLPPVTTTERQKT